MIKEIYKNLDKYYTKKETAQLCLDYLITELKKNNIYDNNVFFIEPSAGGGVFLDVLNGFHSVGFDIEPTSNNVLKFDFLNDNLGIMKNEKNIIIGNPPFGKKGKLALDFIEKSMTYANIIAFILPIQFNKWSLQKNINKDLKLMNSIELPENSFLFLNENYNLRCCFQIWIKDIDIYSDIKNLRILNSPATTHPDFSMYQYNCTKEAEKFFMYEWDFAVLRQGWGDFNNIYLKEDIQKMSLKKQWIFFKAKNEQTLKKLMKLDFNEISKLNTSVKGFGKADIVKFYYNIYGE